MGKIKVGIGIITCNREEMLRVCYDSVYACIEQSNDKFDFNVVIVNDGKKLEQDYECIIIPHSRTQGVAQTKNDALNHLIPVSDYIFLIEEDMKLVDPNVFGRYITAIKETNIQHFNFGNHGPANKRNGKYQPRKIVQYRHTKISLNQHCVGAFSVYTRKCLDEVGIFDERFKNAFDHVEHTYRIAKAKMTTPYWWFADVWSRKPMIEEQACSTVSSSISKDPSHTKNIQESVKLFYEKHGVAPYGNGGVLDVGLEVVITECEEMLKK